MPTVCWTFLCVIAKFLSNCYYSLRFYRLLKFSVMKLEIFAQLSEGKIVGHLSDEMHKVNNKSVVYF